MDAVLNAVLNATDSAAQEGPLEYRRLNQTPADAQAVQEVLDASPQFHLQTGGQRAAPDDGAELLACYPPSAQPAQKAAFLLQAGGRAVGVLEEVSGWPEPWTVFIGLYLLRDDCRGQGLGRRFLERMEQRWRKQGIRRVRLAVLDNNPEGRAFWRAMGFQETGEAAPYQERALLSTVRLMVKVLDPLCRPLPVLLGERVTVRTLRLGDVDAIRDYYARNYTAFGPWEPLRPPDFLTHDYWRTRVAAQLEAFDAGLEVRLVMLLKDIPERVVGSIGLSNLVRGVFQGGTLGYSLDAALWGQGLMREGLERVIGYAFRELGLHRVMANAMPRNERSLKVLERLGFVREGFGQAYIQINGVWEDHVLTSLTNPDWRALQDGKRP